MLLAIDIGNTSIHFGLFSTVGADRQRPALERQWRARPAQFEEDMHSAGVRLPSEISVLIACVNPRHLQIVDAWLRQKAGLAPVVLGRDIPIPVNNLTTQPERVGTDRLMNAIAGYFHTRCATIVVDFGTSMNIDVVTDAGDYLGGILGPGIRTSIKALADNTAQLPIIELTAMDRVLGRNTVEAINSGYYWGYKGMATYLVHKLDQELGVRHKVLFTGGDAELIARDIAIEKQVIPDLTLVGIALCARHAR